LRMLKSAINASLQGVYIGGYSYLYTLNRQDNADGTTRLYTSVYTSDISIDLTLRYEDENKEAALVTGYIKHYASDGSLLSSQSNLDMQDVRYIRREDLTFADLKGTRWYRNSITISGTSRNYPFDCRIIEFFDTEEDTGQVPDNVDNTYPFTYTEGTDALVLIIIVEGETYKANVRVESKHAGRETWKLHDDLPA